MVESGVSAAAQVARLIPRENAWSVTGTPLRKGHRDLFGLMLFLGQEPWCHSFKLWDHLIDHHRPMFRALMREIAIRHSKDFVREDLRLPPQSRHTITLPFTAVEEQHYEHLFAEMCDDIGLDRVGAPQADDWDPEDPPTIEKMRTWLARLRQTCLHPEVGARNRRALGRNTGPLRTVEQVLDVMIEQNESTVRTEQRNLLMSQIRRGQLQENAKQTTEALNAWKAAYEMSSKVADECREQLDIQVALHTATKDAKQKEKEKNTDPEETQDEAGEDEEDLDSSLQIYRQRVRSALEVKHICIFFMANAYFQLKSDEEAVKPDSTEFQDLESKETDAYEKAKAIRGVLLAEVLKKANKLITSVKKKAESGMLADIPDLKPPEEYVGIESRKIFDKLYDFCELMNKQGEYYSGLRSKMVDFLRKSLIDEDEGVELVGDEYEESTKQQDEMYALMEALRANSADRSDFITGQANDLIRQEMRQFARSAKEGEGPAPELMLKLLAERQEVRIDPARHGSLRAIVSEIRGLVTNLQWQEAGGSARARAELVIANRALQHAQQLVAVHTKSLPNLEQEVNLFRDTMNARLDYYRALQKISDTVAPYDEENIGKPLDDEAYARLIEGETRVADKIASLVSKRRYLTHLKTESSSTEPRICTICQFEFDIGTLTVCGHQFCKECIQLWWHEHRTCPICKRKLLLADFFDITYKPAEIVVQAESPSGSVSPASSADSSLTQSIYSDISAKTLAEIKNIELPGPSFGSKVDMLMRHILWLRDHDPGTKCIIFSQYQEFLQVLGRAFKQQKISYSAFEEKNGIEKFKTDPATECFLLHAKAHSAGLNLVVASHVFLCEPLLATAVELQAIARVHRIGQHRATTVWMYIIGGTVEESIYEMSVARRLAHIKSNIKGKGKSRATSWRTSGATTPNAIGLQENAIDVANSLELQAADFSKLLTAGKSGGGEYVDKSDLWQSLFGKVRARESVMRVEDQPVGSDLGRLVRAEAAAARALMRDD
jgi:E3 ubiquitin-protein ligase SHPRH